MMRTIIIWLVLVAAISSSLFFTGIKPKKMITRARAVATAYCLLHNVPKADVQAIQGKPVLSVSTSKNAEEVHIYRWLGNGRGEKYVQVEVSKQRKEITVTGSNGVTEFDPAHYPLEEEKL